MNEGLVYNNIRFEFSDIDEASAFATYLPEVILISAEYQERISTILTRKKRFRSYMIRTISAIIRKNIILPRKLISSTIGDELKIASKGRSDVYAIAPNSESAILSAGHAANGAFWMTITTANGRQRPTTKGFLGMWTATTTARNPCRPFGSRWLGHRLCHRTSSTHSHTY